MFENFRAHLQDQPKISFDHKERLEKLERIIDTSVSNPFLFVRALRHRSTVADDEYDDGDSYERLEFLGDAVLDLLVSEVIFERFPGKNEGFLTKLRSQIVKGDAIADYARKLGLSDLIIIGERAKGQGIEFSKSTLADVFESLVGAIYIDKGYSDAADFVQHIMETYVDLDALKDTLDNYKSLLLEYAQSKQMEIPRYEVVKETGPGHNKTFEVVAVVDELKGERGIGKSKKEAEQKAARKTLQKLQSDYP